MASFPIALVIVERKVLSEATHRLLEQEGWQETEEPEIQQECWSWIQDTT